MGIAGFHLFNKFLIGGDELDVCLRQCVFGVVALLGITHNLRQPVVCRDDGVTLVRSVFNHIVGRIDAVGLLNHSRLGRHGVHADAQSLGLLLCNFECLLVTAWSCKSHQLHKTHGEE